MLAHVLVDVVVLDEVDVEQALLVPMSANLKPGVTEMRPGLPVKVTRTMTKGTM